MRVAFKSAASCGGSIPVPLSAWKYFPPDSRSSRVSFAWPAIIVSICAAISTAITSAPCRPL
jgi:hypothetical protein